MVYQGVCRENVWSFFSVVTLITGLGVLSAHATVPDRTELEEIVVTARKRAEKLQDVPIQVAAFSAQKIADAGIKNTRDFVAFVPNMSFDESYTYLNSFVVVRGITEINNADSPVAVVVDGVAQNNQKQLKMDLYDIQRIEVLKGPQGALYGRNAIGGAINIVTKQPTDNFEGFVNASYGNGNAWDIAGGISGPVVADKILFRIVGDYRQDGGRLTNTYLNKHPDYIDHDYGVRGLLKVMANDNLTLDVRGSYSDFRAGGIYDSITPVPNAANLIASPRQNLLGQTFGHIAELTFKFDQTFDFATLTGITGYTDLVENVRGDLDMSNPADLPGGFLNMGFQAGQGQNLDVKMISQELRLTSPNDRRLRWIAGIYYINTRRSLETRGFIDDTISGIDQFNTGVVIVNPNESNKNNAYAVFGQLDYDLTSQMTISGALRYDYDHRDQTNLAAPAASLSPESFDRIQPKVTLSYHVDDDRLLYVTYSTGFRSGGFNAPNDVNSIFKAENLDNFEAGFKTSWLDRRLIVNGAAYYEIDHDFQYFFVIAQTGQQIIANIDKVDIHGFELEVQALPVEGLEIYSSVGTTRTNIRKFILSPEFIGNKTPKNMTWKLNAGFQYHCPLTDGLSGFVRVDYEHQGKKFWHLDNLAVQKPIDLVNARAGIEGDMWGLYVWGKNLTDEDYYNDYNQKLFSGLPYDIATLAQPRTYGVEARVRF